VTLCH